MNKSFNRQRRHNSSTRATRSVALQQITRFTNLDSSGPLGKLRGTPLQLVEKYQAGAKDAHTQGDDILAQICLQYADHYLRLQNIAIENEQAKIKVEPVASVEPVVEENQNAPEMVEESPSETAETPSPKKSPVVEKKPIVRHKKISEDPLSMPMDALQEKSENIQ